ncbi:MAG: hypothetical protein WB390_09005, partial [Pseudolabrys sp.]
CERRAKIYALTFGSGEGVRAKSEVKTTQKKIGGGGRSPSRTRLQREFPANREINREFRQIPARGAILIADT